MFLFSLLNLIFFIRFLLHSPLVDCIFIPCLYAHSAVLHFVFVFSNSSLSELVPLYQKSLHWIIWCVRSLGVQLSFRQTSHTLWSQGVPQTYCWDLVPQWRGLNKSFVFWIESQTKNTNTLFGSILKKSISWMKSITYKASSTVNIPLTFIFLWYSFSTETWI